MRLKFAIVLAICLGLLGCGHVPLPAGVQREVRAIEQVVETFRLAILNKDKPAYMRLFFSDQPQAIGWQAVVDDAKLAQIQRERPQAIKARPIPANNFIALIDSVLASPTLEEEQIANLQVDTDGEIASASFDYAYLSDGKLSNWGKEQWQLVRTEQGWKIFSVVYTIRDPRIGFSNALFPSGRHPEHGRTGAEHRARSALNLSLDAGCDLWGVGRSAGPAENRPSWAPASGYPWSPARCHRSRERSDAADPSGPCRRVA
jgi:hypothetical protein